MNEISICTNKRSYFSGEIVYGAVYVRIREPTAATGVILRPQGFETYYCKCIDKTDDPNRVIQDSYEYIFAEEINLRLCPSGDPLAIGKFVIPFKKKLPDNLPASICEKSETGPEWFVQVYYGFQAEFIGDSQKTTKCEIIVKSNVTCDDNETSVNKIVNTGGVLFPSSSSLTISAHINNPVQVLPGFIKLTVNFLKIGPNVTKIMGIKIKLERHLQIHFSAERFLEQRDRSPFRKLINMFQHKGQTHSVEPNDCVWLEKGPVVVWETKLQSSEAVSLSKGLTDLHIPLQTKIPSVSARYVKCKYLVSIEVQMHGLLPVQLNISVPEVRIEEQASFKEPVWTTDNDCQVIFTQHTANVAADSLKGHEYCNLPYIDDKLKSSCVMLTDSSNSCVSILSDII